MKRVIAAFVLFAVSVSIAVCSGYVFNSKMNYFEASLYDLIALSENRNDEKLIEECERIVSEWEESLKLLRSVVPHEGIDELSRSILSLPQTVKYTDREQMKEKCIEAIDYIESLKSCEKVSFENIL